MAQPGPSVSIEVKFPMQSVMHSPRRRDGEEKRLLEIVVPRYDGCHPGDSFADLVKRASSSKEDRRLMEDWLDAGRRWRGH